MGGKRIARVLARKRNARPDGFGTADRASAWEGHTHSWAPGQQEDTSRCDECGLTVADELLDQVEGEVG